MLLALWPAALQLLQDNHVEMRQTAAPVVGFLGALAARPGRPAGNSCLCFFVYLTAIQEHPENALMLLLSWNLILRLC